VHWWLLAGLLVAVGAVIAVAAALSKRARRPEQGPQGEREALRAVIDESLADLEREGDARRAVIRAYVGMEQALSRVGLGRRSVEAPHEYLMRVLVAMRVNRGPAERLTALYEWARFSVHSVDAGMKREALAALVLVRDELAEAPLR
jgi:hypothetical protein